MLKYNLLNKELEFYKLKNMTKVDSNYSKKLITSLFAKYKYFGMTESHYCCYGDEICCWQEFCEVGNWSLTTKQVKSEILRNIKWSNKWLDSSKYPDRFHVYKNEESTHVYIYMRDKTQKDFAIWFSDVEY